MQLATNYPAPHRGTLVVWGLLGSMPFGGMVWQALHYLVGLRRLGFDVWYVEDSDRYVYNLDEEALTFEIQDNAKRLESCLDMVGLKDRWVFRMPRRNTCRGVLDFGGLNKLYRRADAVINLCGAQEPLAHHEGIRKLIYVETDPVVSQVNVAKGDTRTIEELQSYQHLFTYATNIGADDCKVPVERFQWHKTVPPVCVDWWESRAAQQPYPPCITTVLNWKHSGKDVEWRGETWRWTKHLEFLRFINLPRRSPFPMELAIGGVSEEELRELHEHGWQTRPSATLNDPFAYRDYLRGSAGEFTAAKEQYVKSRSGWFSDRSVCYLAAGRPVITQDTGFGRFLPIGEGLFAFNTEDEAADALQAIASDMDRHSRAAREIAREHFAAERVLSDMLNAASL